MVFAKTSKAASRLSKEIRENNFNKNYLAIVHGKVNDDTYRDYLTKTDDFSTKIDKNGKLAILSFKLLEYNKNRDISLVDVKLETGRHHQIRVQFSSRNHPLVGDKRYGNDDYKELGLCAYHLEFMHPVKKEIMSFTRYPIGNIWDFKYLEGKNEN